MHHPARGALTAVVPLETQLSYNGILGGVTDGNSRRYGRFP